MTKYNTDPNYGTVDNKTFLETDDDAARAGLGGTWRMPTDDEWAELRDASNCSWTWTTLNGTNGHKVQSKKVGYIDNWIFLPAAGYRSDSNLNCVGTHGSYWSSSLYTDLPNNAYEMHFNSSTVYWSVYHRFNGQSVRPVSK